MRTCGQRGGQRGPGVKGYSLFPPLAAQAVRALLLEALLCAAPAGSGPQLGTFARSVGPDGGVFGAPWPGK